jgi:hypothetical protein
MIFNFYNAFAEHQIEMGIILKFNFFISTGLVVQKSSIDKMTK